VGVFYINDWSRGFSLFNEKFWKKIMMKSFPNQKELKFAIYALGDRSYGDNFCLAARKLRQRLLNL
jgi:sulfite reductase alpha subunit-like flavoprotein